MTAPTNDEINKFREHCVQQPENPLDPVTIQTAWKFGSFKYKCKNGEDLGSIATRYASAGKAPKNCDWRLLARFNFGCDRSSFVNWALIDKFGFEEAKNLKKNKKDYTFKGGEEILIPNGSKKAKVGAVSPTHLNTLVAAKIKPLVVCGPSVMTPDIESEFSVLSYNKPNSEVPDITKNAINWKLVEVPGGAETIHATQGETVDIKYSDTDVGKVFRAYPYIGADSTIIEGVFVEFQVLALEVDKQVALTKVKDNLVLPTDPINKVYNPSAIIIGASAMGTAAIFKVTSVKPTTQANRAKTALLPKSEPMHPWERLSVNEWGVSWKIRPVKDPVLGKAKIIKQGKDLENFGSECYVNGTTAGYLVLEAQCCYAKKPFKTLTLKVVHERPIKYRVNLLKHSNVIKTTFTVNQIKDFFKCSNRYLRQIGLKMVADDTATTYTILGPDNFVVAGAGETGFFNITGVPAKYVNLEDADSELASTINCHPKVLNFVFAYQDKTEADGGGFGFGMGPSAAKNLLTKPEGGVGALAAIPNTFNGVYEDIELSETIKYKNIGSFTTPDTPAAEADKIGILIHNPQAIIAGGKDPAGNDYLTEMGQTIAHEIGHCAALQHRDAGDDGINLASDTKTYNLMFANDHENGPTDLDLLQLNLYRSSILTMSGANNDGLVIKAFTGRTNKISSKANKTKYVNVEVTRKRTRVKNAYINFWVKEPTANTVKIENIDNWQAATRSMDTGMVKLKLKFGAGVGNTAKIIIYAGHEDDLLESEIECEIIAGA